VTLTDTIVQAHREHPQWSPAEIAAAVGCKPADVHSVKHVKGLAIPHAITGRGRKPHRPGRPTHDAFGHCDSRGTARASITMPVAMFDDIKAKALRQDITIAEVIRVYCEIGLAQERAPA